MNISFNNKYVKSIHKQAYWEWTYSFLSRCVDGILVLLRNHQTAAIRGLQHIDDQIIGKHIQLFLLIACNIHLSRKALTVFNETRTYTNIIEKQLLRFKCQKWWKKKVFFTHKLLVKLINNYKNYKEMASRKTEIVFSSKISNIFYKLFFKVRYFLVLT